MNDDIQPTALSQRERLMEAERRLGHLDVEAWGIITDLLQEQTVRAFAAEAAEAELADWRALHGAALRRAEAADRELYDAGAAANRWRTRALTAETRLARKDAPLIRATRRG